MHFKKNEEQNRLKNKIYMLREIPLKCVLILINSVRTSTMIVYKIFTIYSIYLNTKSKNTKAIIINNHTFNLQQQLNK